MIALYDAAKKRVDSSLNASKDPQRISEEKVNNAARVDNLAKATRDAHTRAEAIVSQTGSELGNVRKVNTGGSQITVPNSTRVSSWGSYDSSTIKKDITAVMGVTFEVN